MNKSCLATIVYFAVLGILIYNGMWIWLIIAILVGGLAAFIVFVGVALESGFRSKFPLDFLAHTQWVNRFLKIGDLNWLDIIRQILIIPNRYIKKINLRS